MHLSVSPAFSTRDDAHFKPEIDCPVDYWLTLVSIASSWYEVQSEKEALQSDLERKAEVLGRALPEPRNCIWRPATAPDWNKW
jgi:hypothetical protein